MCEFLLSIKFSPVASSMQNITILMNQPILCLRNSEFDIYGMNKETEGLFSEDRQISKMFGSGI